MQTPSRHDDVCLHHEYLISNRSFNEYSSTCRTHSARTDYSSSRDTNSVITNHVTGSYDTLYEVDSSSSDVVIYWTMTDTHVVSDRQQHDEHTPTTSCEAPTPYASRRYDTWCKYLVSNRSFNKYSSTSSTPSVRTDYSS